MDKDSSGAVSASRSERQPGSVAGYNRIKLLQTLVTDEHARNFLDDAAETRVCAAGGGRGTCDGC